MGKLSKRATKIISVVLGVTMLLSCIFVPNLIASAQSTVEKMYICDFENYGSSQENAKSYDSTKIGIIEDGTNHFMQTKSEVFVAGSKTAFELRNEKHFPVEAKTYTVTFRYKATAGVTVGVGMAKTANVPATAYAKVQKELSVATDWDNESVEITLNKSLADGYSVCMLVAAGETAGQVSFDDIVVKENNYEKFNMSDVNFSSDWYPVFKPASSVPMVAAANDGIDVWDGKKPDTKPSFEGAGTESSPYIIKNGNELAWAINSAESDKYYKLANDIYLNDVSKENWKENSPNDWYTDVSFNGAGIDGNGYVVYGLYIKNTTATDGALIPKIVTESQTVTIKNLGIEDSYINGVIRAAAFVAYTEGENIEIAFSSCYAGSDVTVSGSDAAALICRAHGESGKPTVSITDCYSLATLTCGSDGRTGLVGTMYYANVSIKYSYNAKGSMSSFSSVDYNGSWYIDYSYGTDQGQNSHYVSEGKYTGITVITADNMQGADVFINQSKMPHLNYNNVFVANEGYPTLKVFDKSADDDNSTVWNGTIAGEYAGGNGDVGTPYEISSGAQLAKAINSTEENKYYILTDNIYLNDVSDENWKENSPNGWYTDVSFKGAEIDGNGYVVYGLYIKNTTATVGALIPKINTENQTVEIKNLGIENSYIEMNSNSNSYRAGAIVGQVTDGSNIKVNISNCYVGEDVAIKSYDVGAIVARAHDVEKEGAIDPVVRITDCYSLATLTATRYGLVGTYYQATVYFINCYNAKGPIINTAFDGSPRHMRNCYESVKGEATWDDGTGQYSNATVIGDVANMKGLDALTDDSKMNKLNENNAYVATDSYPALKVFDKTISDDETDDGKIWNGSQSKPAVGKGTYRNPYIISKGAELAWAINSAESDKYYKLANDIYLNDVSKENWKENSPNDWYTDVSFKGKGIDGNGYVVYGLYIKNTTATVGALIPKINTENQTVEIKNLGIDKSYVELSTTVDHRAGAIVGQVTDKSGIEVNISNCYVGEDVTLKAYDVGAIVARAHDVEKEGAIDPVVRITDCYSLAAMTATRSGLVATDYLATVYFINCYNANGKILGSSFDDNGRYMKNCYETVDGKDNTGGSGYSNPVLLDSNNMQGDNVLTDDDKMPMLNENDVFIAREGYPTLKVFDKTIVDDSPAIEIWNGELIRPEGAGTEQDPYLIYGGSELAWAILGHRDRNEGKNVEYFKLVDDIYLNDISKITWKTGSVKGDYTPNKWNVKGEYGLTINFSFQGHIDGNGYTVYGLYYDDNLTKGNADSGNAYAGGLIPKIVKDGVVSVKNLGIDCAYIGYEAAAGAFVGSTRNSGKLTMEKCYTGQNVTIEGAAAGGLLGYAGNESNVAITNCYSLASLIALDGNKTASDGLVGYIKGGTVSVKKSYNGNGKVFGYIEAAANVTAENCYQSGTTEVNGVTNLSVEQMTGADSLENMSGLDKDCFQTSEISFADYDFYIYLPMGTVINNANNYGLKFFDTFLAPINGESVMSGDTMVRGAVVKFTAEPDYSGIVIPKELEEMVKSGTAIRVKELLGYYGIETELVKKNLGNETVNYIFVSDVHYGTTMGASLKKQMELIVDLANESNIDFVAIGGDIAEVNTQAKKGYYDALKAILTPLKECEKPVMVINGNHDDNATYGLDSNNNGTGDTYEQYHGRIFNSKDWNDLLTELGLNKNYIKGNITNNGAEQYKKYFYYDLEGKKTRVICLDASDYPQTFDADGNVTFERKDTDYDLDAKGNVKIGTFYNALNYVGYSETQLNWLENTALTADDDWQYIFLSHMGIDNTECDSDGYSDISTVYGSNELLNIVNSHSNQIRSWQFGHVHGEFEYYRESANIWQITSNTTKPTDARYGTENEASIYVMSVAPDFLNKQVIGYGEAKTYYGKAVFDECDYNTDYQVDIRDLVRGENISASTDVFYSPFECNAEDLVRVRRHLLGIEE